jgi:hypothetical protein
MSPACQLLYALEHHRTKHSTSRPFIVLQNPQTSGRATKKITITIIYKIIEQLVSTPKRRKRCIHSNTHVTTHLSVQHNPIPKPME